MKTLREIEDAVRDMVNGEKIPVHYSAKSGEMFHMNGENYRILDTLPFGVHAVRSSNLGNVLNGTPDRSEFLSYKQLEEGEAYFVLVVFNIISLSGQ